MVKKGTMLFLLAGLMMGAASCSDDDPNENVVPPEVVVTHNISGRITAISGDGITATVSLNGTSKSTAADGTFVFEGVTTGSHAIKAEASGKVAQEATVLVDEADNMNPVWNASLSNEGVTITVNEDGSATGEADSETLKGNEEAEVKMTLTAPAEAVPADVQIIATPVYTADGAAATKAGASLFLIGTNLKCSDASVELLKPITLEYDIDPEMAKIVTAKKYVDNKWVEVSDCKVNNGKVSVTADVFASYALVFDASLSSSASSEAISFTTDTWDNLYGSSSVSVTSATFSYKLGTEINTSKDKFTAYLVEIVARMAGAGSTTVTGTYPLNVTLPVGTAMSISGKQAVTTITASAAGKSASGKQYGGVSIYTNTWNRQHTGGGSK